MGYYIILFCSPLWNGWFYLLYFWVSLKNWIIHQLSPVYNIEFLVINCGRGVIACLIYKQCWQCGLQSSVSAGSLVLSAFFRSPGSWWLVFVKKKEKKKTLVLQLHMQYVLKCKVIIKIVIKNVMLYKDYLK